MRRIILISAVGLGLLAATTSIDAAQTASNHTSRVDACLAAHGWPNGLLALQRAELRAGHPNGLIQTCGGRDAQPASNHTSGVRASRVPASRVDACLRAHGWPNGLLALQRAELRVGHPNGLIRTCGGRDVV